MPKLSILIPTLESRWLLFDNLVKSLKDQKGYNENDVEIVSICDNREMTIGAKRNKLLEMANGEYTCFIDDDDGVTDYYLNDILTAIKNNPDVDCIGITGEYYKDGRKQGNFIHSIKHRAYSTVRTVNGLLYQRPPNHLNPIRSSISKRYKFLENNFGEDTDWAMRISNDRVLKTEFCLHEYVYLYYYSSKK